MRAFAMRLMHLGLRAYVVDDVTTPCIADGDLLLIGSGSGRTASLVQYALRAKMLGARIALISITPSSPIADQSDCVVCIHAPTPKLGADSSAVSIQPMGSLFEQTLGLLLDVIVMQLMTDLDTSAEQMYTRHANLE